MLRSQADAAACGGLPVTHVRSIQQVVATFSARTRFEMVLLSIFAAVALLLASIGIDGLIAYAVQHRTHGIAVRMALGASAARLRTMVVLEGMRLGAVGVASVSAVRWHSRR
jgi:putative ABC transport system permease protein